MSFLRRVGNTITLLIVVTLLLISGYVLYTQIPDFNRLTVLIIVGDQSQFVQNLWTNKLEISISVLAIFVLVWSSWKLTKFQLK